MSWDRLLSPIVPLPTWQENHASLIKLQWVPLSIFKQFQWSCPVHAQWEDVGTCPMNLPIFWECKEHSGQIEIMIFGPSYPLQILPAPPEYIWRYRNDDQDDWHYTLPQGGL